MIPRHRDCRCRASARRRGPPQPWEVLLALEGRKRPRLLYPLERHVPARRQRFATLGAGLVDDRVDHAVDPRPSRLAEPLDDVRREGRPIQHPGAKLKSTIVVHGPQGTGKNLFFEALMRIYGEYGDVIDQSAVEDKFNDWASRKLFMIADEVVAHQAVAAIEVEHPDSLHRQMRHVDRQIIEQRLPAPQHRLLAHFAARHAPRRAGRRRRPGPGRCCSARCTPCRRR